MGEVVIDVREKDEFDAEHVPGSLHAPLSRLHTVVPGILAHSQDKPIVVMCRSGNRARMAVDQLHKMGLMRQERARIYNGGILEWKRQGNPTVQYAKNHLPLLRQVQLTVGLLTVLSAVLGAFVNPWFHLGAAFMGAGLSVAGATGFCGMAVFLARMPWNSKVAQTPKELKQISPVGHNCCQ